MACKFICLKSRLIIKPTASGQWLIGIWSGCSISKCWKAESSSVNKKSLFHMSVHYNHWFSASGSPYYTTIKMVHNRIFWLQLKLFATISIPIMLFSLSFSLIRFLFLGRLSLCSLEGNPLAVLDLLLTSGSGASSWALAVSSGVR